VEILNNDHFIKHKILNNNEQRLYFPDSQFVKSNLSSELANQSFTSESSTKARHMNVPHRWD
jgi:hypothetical protein